MSISSRKTPDPFARVSKTILDDDRLSWRAKGIAAYLVGKPDGWKLRVTDLVKHGTDGKHAIRAALNELREFGYAEYTQSHVDGRLQEGHWEVSDKPIYPPRSKNRNAVISRSENQDAVPQASEDQDHSKNDSNKNEHNKKDMGVSDEQALDEESELNTSSSSSPNSAPPSSPSWVPAWDEVNEWAKERKWPIENAAEFFNYYDSLGWEWKGSKIKNWRAKAMSWLNRWRQEKAKQSQPAGCNLS